MSSSPHTATGGTSFAALGYLIRCEVLKLVRLPLFAIPTFVFPLMFFAMFGLPNAHRELNGISAGPYILASFGTYAVMTVALFSFGIAIASERGLGWNRLSGLLVPLGSLPRVVQRVAPYLPDYHTGQPGWTLLGAGDGKGLGIHALWLAAYSLAFLALALLAYRRDEGRSFG